MSKIDYTKLIITELTHIKNASIAQRDTWRIRAYTKAIEAIQSIDIPIHTIDDVQGVSHIGINTIKKIQEIIDTGKSKKADQVRNDPDISLIVQLTHITGVGPVLANKLVKIHHVSSIQDLLDRQKTLLTPRQQLGLKHFHDTMLRIPRTEMDTHHKYITGFSSKINATITISGSYRRGASDCGDIDVLIRDDHDIGTTILQTLIQLLKEENYIIDDIASGETKYNGYCRLSTGRLDISRRIDILYTTTTKYPFALLYFTGSGPFNQELRSQLSKKQLRLNEHGLKKKVVSKWFPVNTKHIKTEQDIFKLLNIPYIIPSKRTRESLISTSKPNTLNIKDIPTTIRTTQKHTTLRIKPTPDSSAKVTTINGHTIKSHTHGYSCNCDNWLYQSLTTNLRTCKHIKQLLGDIIDKPIQTKPSNGKIEPLLAQKWNPETTNPTGWWMSEKLDGIRAIWDGNNLISRLGNTFPAPKWFLDSLPKDIILDGELFSTRKNFQETVSIVRNSGLNKEWTKISYMVFDAPNIQKPFEERIQHIQTILKQHRYIYTKSLDQTKVINPEHVMTHHRYIESLGGEGVMLRQPGSKYVNGRSNTLLKVKSFYDAEAKVIKHAEGRGRNSGRMGALICLMECGKQFRVGTGFSDTIRNNPPQINSIITYRFQELTKSGVPRFPSYVGPRIDLDKALDYKF